MDEYIKREYAVDAVLDVYYDTPDIDLSGEKFEAAIRKIQAADVAPLRHGRWISWEKAGNFVPSPDRHECSVCHDAAQVLVNGFELLSDYCPNCGAKMMEG